MKIQKAELLKLAANTAVNAGKLINAIYKSGFSVDYKEDMSPLTTADIAANRAIKSGLSVSNIDIVSEEDKMPDFQIRKNLDCFWLVDPLDGTKEFINSNTDFTVNIALIINTKPEIGVIYIPVDDIMYFAATDIGAFKMTNVRENWDEQKDIFELTVLSRRLPLSRENKPFTVVASRSHKDIETIEYINKLKLSNPDLKEVSRGSSLKFCIIAEGSANVYPRFSPTNEWDTAAGNAIVNIAGGKVLTFDGSNQLKYNKKEMVNPAFVVYPPEVVI